jgi:23S rRNA (uridine2552-2'-O)-methyltransferase
LLVRRRDPRQRVGDGVGWLPFRVHDTTLDHGSRMGSKLSDRGKRHDPFFQRARKQGFVARSAFKLEEMDQHFQLIRKRARVLDLGCRPGSWLQYVAKVAGEGAQLVGVDRTPLDVVMPHCRVLVGDVFDLAPAELVGELGAFDVVLSDMAPDTCGVRSADQARSEALFERALFIAEQTLVPGGHFVGKLFQGPDFQKLIKRARAEFSEVRMFKPEASRKESIEQYMVALGRRPPAP